jgi:hemerythrin-like domain-containing protein
MDYKGMPYSKSPWSAHFMPIGYLMLEHRLIERMVKIMAQKLSKMKEKNKVGPDFITTAIDFLRAYADKCHHGKEEDILFKELLDKKISSEHKRAVEELIEEHKKGRVVVGKLEVARENYANGKAGSLKDIKAHIKWLIEFYPRHIGKEDKEYFIPFMGYFTKPQQDKMLVSFCEFDSTLTQAKTPVQDKYRNIVEKLEHYKAVSS